jgi:hypothetical protein
MEKKTIEEAADTWEHWVECLQDYADKNARIQIEKDRERVKANAKTKVISEFEVIVDLKSIDEIPIILD